MSWQNKTIAITPFICAFVFLLLGFADDLGISDKPLWHPGWVVFFLIPLMPFLVGKKKIRFSVPFIIAALYVALGLTTKLWHPGWIIFLLIPIFEIIMKPSDRIFRVNSKENNDD